MFPIAISYPFNEFKGVSAENFAALWVGKIRVNESTLMDMRYDLSWAQLQVRINGQTVHEYRQTQNGQEGGRFDLLLPKGEHQIEVEYINHWHTVDFSMHPQPKILSGRDEAVRSLLDTPGYAVVHAKVYESRARDNTVKVSLPESNRPMILLLESYRSVFWNILPHANLKAVVIVDGRGTVSGGNAPVYRVKRLPRVLRPDFRYYEYGADHISRFQAP